jgi:hypothetical protein
MFATFHNMPSHLEGPEQVDLDDPPKPVEQVAHFILVGRPQHLGKKQLHSTTGRT